MTTESKIVKFNPAVLPLEYSPKIKDVSDGKHKRYYLIPGQVFASSESYAISAIIGSGAALCLWDSVRHIGGACHYLFPDDATEVVDPKYAKFSFELLLSQLSKHGANLCNLEAKIFGGSQPAVKFGNNKECLGIRNVEIGIAMLNRKGIQVVSKEVGGTQGRKIVFQTDDGVAWSEKL